MDKQIMIGKQIMISLIIGSIVAITFSIIHYSNNAEALITKDMSALAGIDYKIFHYGDNPNDILKGTKAQYEIGGYPSTTIMISNWNELTELEKASITTQLEAMGYHGEDR